MDWLIPPTDRIIILQFLSGGSINATASTTQAPFHHPAAQIRAYLAAEENWWPCSPEFINYALALLVFSVRYPAVFWNTNKGFSFLFSVQLLANSFQVTIAFSNIWFCLKIIAKGYYLNILHALLFLFNICVIYKSYFA